MPLLIDRWQKRLVNYARLVTKDPDLAKDIIQDTWLNVIRNLPALRDPGSFRPWLYRSVNNRINDHFKHQKVVSNHVEVAMNTDPVTGSDKVEDHIEREEVVGHVLQQLSTDHRRVLALHYLGEFEVEEISSILAVPEGTVKSRLHHAREQFRKRLEIENE